MQAIWKGTVIADSGDTVIADGNHYFPLEDVKAEYLRESDTTSVCGWKGTANYWSLVVDDETNPDAAWTYREPKEEAQDLAGRVAFWNGVQVREG